MPRNPGAVGASCGEGGQGADSISSQFLPPQVGSGQTYNLCLHFGHFPGDGERPRQGWDVVLQMSLAQRRSKLWGASLALLELITGVGTDDPGADVGSWILSRAGKPRGLGRGRQFFGP